MDHDLCISVSHLSNESADIPDVINSNWEFDVSLILSHASNLNSFGLNPTVQIILSSQSTEREKISTSGCHFWHPRHQDSGCLRSPIILIITSS